MTEVLLERPSKKQRTFPDVEHLRTPCYLVDRAVARENAERMLKRAQARGLRLRPHVKTHKSLEGAVMQTGGSRRGIVVSTLAEAKFFADGGFDDILYAVPVSPDKLDQAAALTARLDAFHVVVDHPDSVSALLARSAPSQDKQWSVVVMVDCGYHRDGVDPDDDASVELVRCIAAAQTARFAGIYTHGGHSYEAASTEDVVRVGEEERDAVLRYAKKLRLAGLDPPMVGVGSTPTCSNMPESLEGVTEIHPGNYLYYDWTQVTLGSCRAENVAVRVCTRVIGKYQKQNTLLIDLGWTGISAQGAHQGYGYIDGYPELIIKVLKQEAGEVTSRDGSALEFHKYPIGFILFVIPWHSCAASHQHTGAHVVENGKIVGWWEQVRGW